MQPIVPEPLRPAYDVFGFAPGIRTENDLIISGMIGADANLAIPEALDEEVRAAFGAIGLVLEEAGARFSDVISLRSFHVSDTLQNDANVFLKVKGEFMDEPHCAWTMAGVSSLLIPAARVEIEAVARLG